LGNAIGLRPKDKIFEAYVQIELQLGNVDRCRIIYEKWLETSPSNCNCWVKFAQLERDLGEIERSRGIFELAISQPLLDMPEILWKAYIDFEIEQESYDNARNLYKRLLERTKHVKVWISYAQFEKSIQNISEAREVYKRAFEALKNAEDKEERVALIESWKEFEESIGDKRYLDEVLKKMPKKVVKKRQLKTEDGTPAGWEEYHDYIFPGEESAPSSLKLLEKAKQWKKQKQQE
jgi:crooked neck